MKKFKTGREKFGWIKGFAACAIAAGIFWMTAFTALAAEGEITAETAKIRAQASTDSEVVASTVKGKKVDLIESVKDSAGVTWYKVPIAGGGYGYIRGDLVKASGEVPAASTSSQAEQPTESTSQPAETVPTSIGEQAAVIQCETNAKIRSGASTSHSVVTSLPNGTSITLIGEANDNAGNKWYQLKADYNNRTIEGYVRSDLIAIGAQGGDNSSEGEGGGEAPAEGENSEGGEGENPEGEGQAPEETEPEPEPEQDNSHMDYEIRWAKNQDNEDYDYFLYDNTTETGTRMRLSEVLNAATGSSAYTQKLQDQIDKNKIIIIILAAVIVLLFVIITIMIFKIRSLYYEDYDEDEEEEEEEPEPVPVKKKVRRKVEVEEEEPVPVRKKKPVPREEATGRSSERPVRPKREAEPEIRAAERKEATKKPTARKSQNFLVDDDEFEFEFLNMDDKDL